MEQQTAEWLAMRKKYIGGSDAPIVMEESPWKTPYQLWLEKVSETKPTEKTERMIRGIEMEPLARGHFCLENDVYVKPQIIFHSEIKYMMCSLDGLSDDKKVAVEIKCPSKADHIVALNGMVPDKYKAQLQHQLEVCRLDMMYYYSFDGNAGATVRVYRDEKYLKDLLKKEEEFWSCVENFQAPKGEYTLRDDDLWCEKVKEWKALEFAEKRREALRKELIDLANGTPTMGGGIKIAKHTKKGNVDYTKIPELSSVNLELYRKDPVEYWRFVEL